MMKKILYTLLAFSPIMALAQSSASLNGVGSLALQIKQIISADILPLLFAVAIVVFFWGLVVFIINAGDAEKRKEGQQMMIWAVVALVVMVCIYGLIGWLGGVFNLNQGGSVSLPTV